MVREAHDQQMDLDHAVAMVRERTKTRYRVFEPDADPAVAAKFERLNGARSNVSGILHAIDRGTA
jgi:hypothetical protein